MEWFALHIFPSFFYVCMIKYYNEFNEASRRKKKGIYRKNLLSQFMKM